MIRKDVQKVDPKGFEIHHVMTREEFNGHGRMFAKVVLHKGEEVSWHTHTDEIEYYYVLSGSGVFTDSAKQEFTVGEGDVCLMEVNGGHAIRQTGEAPLIFMALIINL